MFYDILEKKKSFLSYKNKMCKESKNWNFFKGASLWFWSKIVNFSLLLFYVTKAGKNVFHNILERTHVFLSYKNKKLKKSKNQNFPKGLVHGFGLKWSIFPSFGFREKTPGRCVSRYSRKKKRLSTPKKKEVQKVENFYFSKGVSP